MALVHSYSTESLYDLDAAWTEAQKVIGLLAAGPLKDLLSTKGTSIIYDVEREARRDRRMAWALGGVWRFKMSDDVWTRVQIAADRSWWEHDAKGSQRDVTRDKR